MQCSSALKFFGLAVTKDLGRIYTQICGLTISVAHHFQISLPQISSCSVSPEFLSLLL